MWKHARTLHKLFDFDWFLGLEDLAPFLGKGSFTGTHNDSVTGYSDGWGTILGHCINGLNLIAFLD